jgi:hypothetical protein
MYATTIVNIQINKKNILIFAFLYFFDFLLGKLTFHISF